MFIQAWRNEKDGHLTEPFHVNVFAIEGVWESGGRTVIVLCTGAVMSKEPVETVLKQIEEKDENCIAHSTLAEVRNARDATVTALSAANRSANWSLLRCSFQPISQHWNCFKFLRKWLRRLLQQRGFLLVSGHI